MSDLIDSFGIAARILGLVGGQDHGMIEATARRLGVSEVALRITIDRHEPHPTIEVIAAVVRYYGVDPTWVLSGEYDVSSHRAAIGEEAEIARSELLRLIAKRFTPPNTGAQPTAPLRLEA